MKINKIWITLILMFTLLFVSNVESYHVSSPICSYLHVGPSNVSDGAATQNQTFKTIIRTDSNQTSGSTYVRLTNQNGATLFTNTTGFHRNTTGETAQYEVSYAPSLDAQQTYTVSATYFFLNNTFVNYSITERACANRTFVVDAISGGFAVTQEKGIIQLAKDKGSTTTIIIIVGLAAVLYMIYNKK